VVDFVQVIKNEFVSFLYRETYLRWTLSNYPEVLVSGVARLGSNYWVTA